MNRPTLSLRDRGVEKLLIGLPDYAQPEKLEPTRQWAVAMMACVSRWQMERHKQNALATFGSRTNG